MVEEYAVGTTAAFLGTLPQGSASTKAVCLSIPIDSLSSHSRHSESSGNSLTLA